MNVRFRSAMNHIASALLIAVLVNVLVAWALARRGAPSGGTLRFEAHCRGSGPWRAVAERRGLGFARRCEMLCAPTSYGGSAGSFTFELGPSADPKFPLRLAPMQTLRQADPVLAAQVERGASGGPIAIWPLQDCFGWPCLSMAYWHGGITGFADAAVMNPGSRAGFVYGITLKPKGGAQGMDGRALPYAPLWMGFIANTAIFAGIIWACHAIVGNVRMRRRRRQGTCVACGYLLAGVPRCPECGLDSHAELARSPVSERIP